MRTLHWIGVLGVAVAAAGGGWWANGRFGAGGSTPQGPCPGGAMPAYWRAPMDPTYVRDEPGKSPMGMDLVPVCPEDTADPASASTPGVVGIDRTVIQSMGVRTTRAEQRDLVRHIRTLGRVAWDERRVTHVHTKVQGWVEQLHVQFEGQRW